MLVGVVSSFNECGDLSVVVVIDYDESMCWGSGFFDD